MKEVIQILKTKFTPEEMEKLYPVLANGIFEMLFDVPCPQNKFVPEQIERFLREGKKAYIESRRKAPKRTFGD